MVGTVQTPIATNLTIGTNTQLDTYDRQGAQQVSESHGRFYNMAYGGNLFTTSVPGAGVNIPTTLTTLASKFCLLNPYGSGVNMELIRADLNMAAATPVVGTHGFTKSNQTTAGLGTLTSGVINNMNVNGGRTSQINFYTAATHADTPVWFYSMFSCSVASAIATPNFMHMFDGSIIIPPGNCIDWVMSTTGISAVVPQVVWAEWPI